MRKTKHVDTVVNCIRSFPLTITNALSNTHNNSRPKVGCFATNLSKSSCADQDVVSDEYYRTTSYPTDSVVFQGSKSRIVINFSIDYLKVS